MPRLSRLKGALEGLVSPGLWPYFRGGLLLVALLFASLLAAFLLPVGTNLALLFLRVSSYAGLVASVVYFLFAVGLVAFDRRAAWMLAVGLTGLAFLIHFLLPGADPWRRLLNVAILNSFALFFVSGVLAMFRLEDSLEEAAARAPRGGSLVPAGIAAALVALAVAAALLGLASITAGALVGAAAVGAAAALARTGYLSRDREMQAYLLSASLVLLAGLGSFLLTLRPDRASTRVHALGAYAFFFLSLLYTANATGQRTCELLRMNQREFVMMLALAGVMAIIADTQIGYLTVGTEAFTRVAQAKFDYYVAGLGLGFLLYYARPIQDFGDALVAWVMRRRRGGRAWRAGRG